jgi:hypothetical protein
MAGGHATLSSPKIKNTSPNMHGVKRLKITIFKISRDFAHFFGAHCTPTNNFEAWDTYPSPIPTF